MKKTINILVVLIILVATLCGCGTTNKTVVNVNETSIPDSLEEIDLSIFREVEATSKNLSVYREEVLSRTENAQGDDIFISPEDWNIIQLCWDESDVLDKTNVSLISYSKLYNETSKYYYPVVFRDGQSLILWYTTEYGSVVLEELYGYWNGSNYMGEAHSDEDGITLENHHGSKILYNQETGKVDYWSFGKKYETVDVPKGAEYCGHSYFEGYLFRLGSDVYALRTRGFEDGKQVECIAHNVKYVIDASYDFDSDPWSQPLFFMEDGSIKCYIDWMGEEDSAPDHSSHLCDLQIEGGYHKGNK